MNLYPFADIEKKWQEFWESRKLHVTDMDDTAKKLYCLVMFIYPSGDRLHMGHWYNYGPTDSWARFKRMQGYNVFEPMGYDAFGLPAENYAIKNKIHPAVSTQNNINAIREQLKAMGAMYDWSRELATHDPAYYRWTQWFFLLLYKHGLAYRKRAPVNWCPSCKTVLANEQVVEGRCERCSSEVTHRDMEQWFFRITHYADRLLEGLDRIDWPEKTVTMQKNWIGRSEGAWVRFPIAGAKESAEVFTTRPDTLWGVTYMVLAPEHPLVEKIAGEGRQKAVRDYVEAARRQSEIARTSVEKEKTGVFTGAFAINPVNGEKVPVWIADYVLVTYGTGAVMAVPGHDERDFAFAKKFGLPVREVISSDGRPHGELAAAYVDPGIMIESGPFTGEPSESGIRKVIRYLDEKGWGGSRVSYKLRDWLVSRQRYWGAPIPMVYCGHCGIVPVPEDRLPVVLPHDVEFRGTGESPLLTNEKWMNTECPACGKTARREADTLDTFVCSSWYYLRFVDPHYRQAAFNPTVVRNWLPVDQYVGGTEHTVLHLMYARFFTKVLYDLGLVPFDEPFQRLIHQGVITNQGAKMSKSKGNVINPDSYIRQFGSDVLRMYIMFMGSYTEGGDWNDEGIQGMSRFLSRVWRLSDILESSPPEGREDAKAPELERACHHAVKMVTHDLERFQFNTSISRIMELVNSLYLYIQDLPPGEQNREAVGRTYTTLIQLLAPFAPHLAEEMWERAKKSPSVFGTRWPEWDEETLRTEKVTIPVQINGKVRSQLEIPRDATQENAEQAALADPKVRKYTEGAKPKKVIYVKNKLISIVV